MKRILCFCVSFMMSVGMMVAQKPDLLIRNVLETIDGNEKVERGEFQVDLPKTSEYKTGSEMAWLPYVYTTKNKYTGVGNVFLSGRALIKNPDDASQKLNIQLRTYRIGPQYQDGIFVIKNIGASTNTIGANMEIVIANGIFHQACDTVLHLSDDGYVCMREGKCFYCSYLGGFEQPSPKPVVWLQSNIDRLSKGDIVHESADGHYYYLHRDEYMTNTVLVVNDEVVELFGVYEDADFRLKYSSNGEHWMAAGEECYWIDGVMRSVQGYAITDFIVADSGQYSYRAYQKEMPQKGEMIVVDGEVILNNAEIVYYDVNANGQLIFRFKSGGRCLQYENGNIVDVTATLASISYPSLERQGAIVSVMSDDGLHRLSYRKGQNAVYIDGVKVSDFEPCYAVFDEKSHSFLWNAIESREDRTELVTYKYRIE